MTKVAKLLTRLKKQVIALATQAITPINPPSDSNVNGGKPCSKKDGLYTFAEWQLIKKEDTVTFNGKTYHRCIGDHYSCGEKYNKMYANHKSCDHDVW
jgi:hypothetical protein